MLLWPAVHELIGDLCAEFPKMNFKRMRAIAVLGCLHVSLLSIVVVLSACCRESEIPDQIKKLASTIPHTRSQAALALARCGPPEVNRAVPLLIDMLYDDNIGVQSAASYALRHIDTPAARDAIERATKRRKVR